MGEISKHDAFGSKIIEIVRQYNINKILEIGSWDGTGSTQCFIEGMQDLDNKHLICLEVEPNKVQNLIQNTKHLPWVNVVCQTTITYDQLIYKNFEEIWTSPFNGIVKDDNGGEPFKKALVESWFNQDIEKMKMHKSSYITDHKNDFYQGVMIDGGEFNGFTEYTLLKDRTNYFFLDDYYKAFKTRQVAYDLEKSGEWEVLCAEKHLRNGFAILKRKHLINV
jgi:hypothetical protein